jgi:hypothetical protein
MAKKHQRFAGEAGRVFNDLVSMCGRHRLVRHQTVVRPALRERILS